MTDFAPRHAPDDLKSVEYAKPDGSIRTMHVSDGLLKPQNAEDDAALESLGYDRAEAASKAKSADAGKDK
jgi:hypothetical protein